MADDERPGVGSSPAAAPGGLGVGGLGGVGGLDSLDQLVEVGRGGFAVVYRAWQAAFNRPVAVKVISVILDEGTLRRFERECVAVGALSGHPHIVTVHELGRTPEGRPYIVMEYLERGSVAQHLAEHGPFDPAAVLDLGVKIAGALESAHRIGVLHRDIKPENVLLSRFGEPKLADFGIASVAGRTETRSGSVTASIAHAAPEILNGERPTVATDVYSLASTLYTLLTGGPAFVHVDDETVLPIVARIAADPVPDLRPRGVPDALCRVVEQGMAKEPGARQGSALEIARRLQDAQIAIGLPPTRLAVETEPPTRSPAAPVPSPPPPSSRTDPTVMAPSPPAPLAPPLGRVERRRPKAVIAAGVLFAVAVASAVAVWLGARSPSPSASPPPTSSAPAAPAAVETESVVFRDDFSSDASGWATGDKPEESITYAAGRYVFRVEISPYTQVTDTYFEGDAYRDALTKLADVAVEVTVFPGANADAGFGVMCRGRYLAFVTGRGAWTLQRLGAEPAQLASGTAPLAGTATDPRRLRLECSGAENGPVTLTFSVDGNVVGRTVDPTGLGPGSVGLAVTTASGPFDGAFDDFVVRRL